MTWERYQNYLVRQGRRPEVPGPQFFETRMGHQFYEGTMPRIANALERIAVALERIACLPTEDTKESAPEQKEKQP